MSEPNQTIPAAQTTQGDELIPFGAEPDKSRSGVYITAVLVAIWYLFLVAMVFNAVSSR